MQSLQFRAMNTDILLALEGQGGSEEALQAARLDIEDFEQRFSRFLPGSELSQLNARAGEWVDVSEEMLDLLILSRAYYQETGGLFDPSVLPDLKRAGYDASFELVQAGAVPPSGHPHKPRAPFDAVELDTAAGRVRLPEGVELDLGGIAKGWIVQRTAEQLRSRGTAAAVSAGGDIYFAGLPLGEQSWRVEIEDPRELQRTAAVLHVGEGAVITSSVSKRAWDQAGRRQHHIIDPRSGEPANTQWLSVTVIAPRADLAEAYAKALLIGSEQEARRLMLQRPHLAAVTIGADGRLLASHNAKEYLHDGYQYIPRE